MFTGAQPQQHGIRRYERPVLRCDTLFDALIRAGKRIAIVAVRESSVDLLFRGRLHGNGVTKLNQQDDLCKTGRLAPYR